MVLGLSSFTIVSDNPALYSRWLPLLKTKMFLIFYYWFIISQNELKSNCSYMAKNHIKSFCKKTYVWHPQFLWTLEDKLKSRWAITGSWEPLVLNFKKTTWFYWLEVFVILLNWYYLVKITTHSTSLAHYLQSSSLNCCYNGMLNVNCLVLYWTKSMWTITSILYWTKSMWTITSILYWTKSMWTITNILHWTKSMWTITSNLMFLYSIVDSILLSETTLIFKTIFWRRSSDDPRESFVIAVTQLIFKLWTIISSDGTSSPQKQCHLTYTFVEVIN